MSTLKHASENEMRIGIEIFYTATPGIKGKLRKSPDDFIVDEIPLPLKTLEPQENLVAEPQSKYVVARVRVVNWETNSLVRELSKQLGIPRQHIYFAGTKDKRAVTTQTMVFKTAPENILNIAIQGVEVCEIGTRNNPIKLGDLLGNKFKINVRELKLS
ncbi:tRNA pseudouridine(13) synthase TruD, partial [bacterium]|nr:tRNA pseudouridine(13) synthase TruD [bacterium]